TWTSPGHQEKPVAWRNYSFEELTRAVHDFTHEAIYEMRTNGTRADMVQIGNEISDGMLFPDGRRSDFDKFAILVKAGIAGAKEADPAVKIVLHHHLGRSNEQMVPWIDNFIRRGTKFDIIGMSCYAQAKDGDWKANFDDLAKRYPDKGLLVLEYSAQKRYINDLMFQAPDRKGLGTFIWEPTRYREALFDKVPAASATTNSPEAVFRSFGTNETARAAWRRQRFGGRCDANELFNLYPQMAHDYGND